MPYSKTNYSLLQRVLLSTALMALLASTLTGQTGQVTNGSVPPNLKVPAGHLPFLKTSAIGTQNFICLPSGWAFLGPQATFFVNLPWITGPILQQVGTHFLTPSPTEPNTNRPLWQNSIDSSIVWAKPIETSSDPAYVDPAAIPWLLLETVATRRGPAGGSTLSQTTYVQRVNTTGGLTPTGPCAVGARDFVPYTADYVFYRKAGF